MLNSYICALDIGASKIAAAVAQIKKGRIAEIFFEATPAKGMRGGTVSDSVALNALVSKTLKKLKSRSGLRIKYVYANISGTDIITKHSRAIIPLAERGNKVITLSDIQKVNEQARLLGSSLEEEIIHQTPFSYGIDSRGEIASPLGLYSHRLEADVLLVCARLSAVQSLARVINQSAVEIKRLFFSGMATAKAVFDPRMNNGLTILCDIGSDISEILLFKDGMLRDISVLKLGSDDLSAKLAAELGITPDLAEDVKRSHAAGSDSGNIPEEKEILVKKESAYQPIKQKVVAQVIERETRALCEKIKEVAAGKARLNLVDNFVVVGRGVLLEGFLETLEHTLGVPIKLGRISEAKILPLVAKEDNLSGSKYLTYITCLGMISLALQKESAELFPALPSEQKFLSRVLTRAKEVYQEYF
jgi:cell division protein FtsA